MAPDTRIEQIAREWEQHLLALYGTPQSFTQ
jgi:hypothetical protein